MLGVDRGSVNAYVRRLARYANRPVKLEVLTQYAVTYTSGGNPVTDNLPVLASKRVVFVADTAAPVAGTPMIAVRTATGFTRIVIPFDADDLSSAFLVRKNFELSQPQAAGGSNKSRNVYIPSRDPVYDRGKTNRVTLELDYVPPGSYTLTLNNSAISDQLSASESRTKHILCRSG